MHHWKLTQQRGNDSGSTIHRLVYRMLGSDDRSAIANWLNIWNFEVSYGRDVTHGMFNHRDMKRSSLLHLPPLYLCLSDLPLVKSLVNRACDISERTGYFGCSLAAAAQLGHRDIVGYLLANVADPNLPCGSNYGTALRTACVGYVTIVRTLIDDGAGINAQDGFFNTPIVAAMSNEHFDIAKLLISRGADMTLGSSEDCHLYVRCRFHRGCEMVKMLLGAGQDVNRIGLADRTLLYGASFAGSISLYSFFSFMARS
jgi:Ankyrin repeats (3 copies)